MLAWLLGDGLGPAAVAVPVNWAAAAFAGAAQRWFKRLRRTDDLSRLVTAATGTSVDLTQAEFDAVRKLLEDQQTWSTVIGRGTVDDLATRIAACLPPRDGRTAGDAHAAALTIARGLLEFAVADLDPKLFQQVLMARLQRMETGQASELDRAMFDLHADLTAGFASVMDQLKLVLDRLPEGPAGRGEIAVYLRMLIDWLNTDPWPQDLDGPVLTPAAIERKLLITARGPDRGQDLDADGLAQQCARLVILGGPGSGKTWLAKRTARRGAEDALQVLAAGGTLDEVELPLYTTCSRLFGARGDIREAVVSSALDQIGDLGGSRISKTLGGFFTERNAPTLLVIDSLDEAHGPSERLHQAGTLPWRIVLTSRPSTWRHQLTINDTDDSHRVGELQPLDYPGDVKPFIEHWFAGRPERGNDLAAQIAQRPDLQQAATVPLILAFYCIIGGTGQLPGFRHKLYTSVLNRMLTGRWRDDDPDRRPDADACLQTLQAWAWDGAASNYAVSGVGTWTDDIPTKRVRLGRADADALDHVAAPLGRPDVDTRETLRRFIHRSIREHLVAEHVAGLPVDQAVEILLPHLWYDPDWEYAAPAALARHPQRDQLLQALICRAASSDQIPADLSVIDAGWEFRGLLARVAAESSEADWSPEIAGMVGQARVELAQSGRFGDLGGAAHWGTSDRQARDALLALLARETGSWEAAQLADGLAQLDPTAEDRRQARDALLGLLADETDSWRAAQLAGGLAQLATTAEDKCQARDALLALARETNGWGQAQGLADRLAQLATSAEDKRQAREALLALLASKTYSRGAAELADGLAQLDPTAEDKRQGREALLALLARETDSGVAEQLAYELAQLDPTAEDRRQARDALLALARETNGWGQAQGLADRLAQLATSAEDKRQARDALLGLLASKTDSWTYSWEVAELTDGLAQLDPTAEDKRQGRDALLGLLAGEADSLEAAVLAGALAQLDPTAEDRRQARDALLALLANETDSWRAAELADGLPQLDPTAEDRRQARDALLALLADETDIHNAEQLAGGLAQLDPTAEDKGQARDALLALARETDSLRVKGLFGVRLVSYELNALLRQSTDSHEAEGLAGALAQLAMTAEDKRQARKALVGLLARETDSQEAEWLVGGLAQLDPTVYDLRTWPAWSAQPTAELLAAVRRNSALTNWLAALPSLTSLSGSPA